MLSGCYGLPIRTFTALLLWTNVILNLYNLLLISFNGHSPQSELVIFLGTQIVYEWWLILIQTILILCAIISIHKKSNTRGIIFVKYWSFGLTVVFLVLEIQAIIAFMIFIYKKDSIGKYWENIKNNVNESFSPVCLYISVTLASFFFLGFKSFSAAVMFHFGNVSADYLSETGHDIGSDNEIESCRFRSRIVSISWSPPPYDSSSPQLGITSVHSSSPPPRYVDVFKY